MRRSSEDVAPPPGGRGEGALGGTVMCHGHELFSGQSVLPSLPIFHQCATHVPPIFKFYKTFAFSALFLAKISALKRQNFQIFPPMTPHFRNPCGTYPPKKS